MKISSAAFLAIAALVAAAASANAERVAWDWSTGDMAHHDLSGGGETTLISIDDPSRRLAASFDGSMGPSDGQGTRTVPTPGSLALVGVAGLIGLIRHKR